MSGSDGLSSALARMGAATASDDGAVVRDSRAAQCDDSAVDAGSVEAGSVLSPTRTDPRHVSSGALLRERVPADVDSQRAYLMRYAFALCHDLGLQDDERRELAMMLPTRMDAHEPVSWTLLDVGELAVMVHWLNGATKVYSLLRLRPPLQE